MAQWDFYYHFARICLHSCFGSAIPDYLTASTIQVLEERHPTSDYPNQVLCSHGEATEQCHRVWIQGRVALSNSFMLILQCGITCFAFNRENKYPHQQSVQRNSSTVLTAQNFPPQPTPPLDHFGARRLYSRSENNQTANSSLTTVMLQIHKMLALNQLCNAGKP